jgi:hypothetical protein
LLIGERGRLAEDVSGLFRLPGNEPAGSNTVISGEFASKEPEFSLRIIRVLLEHNVRVYHTPVSLPNLLLEDGRVFEILGSIVHEMQRLDGRAMSHEIRWVLTGKYLMFSGSVQTVEFPQPTEEWIRLRDSFGYRNFVLDRPEGHDIRVRDSLEVIGLHLIGQGDFPVVEAVWVEKAH